MKRILETLKNREIVSDQEFDQIFPDKYQEFSDTHFTPVEVAVQAAEFLVTSSNTRVLDVGSGVGKFCLIGALITPGHFVGIEQRTDLVKLAQTAVDAFNIPRTEFFRGDARHLDWNQFQSFYLFNPFVENLYAPEARMDQSGEFNETRYQELVRWVQQRLHLMPVGTRVCTFHGFGGDMPPGYELKEALPCGGDFLHLWIKEV